MEFKSQSFKISSGFGIISRKPNDTKSVREEPRG